MYVGCTCTHKHINTHTHTRVSHVQTHIHKYTLHTCMYKEINRSHIHRSTAHVHVCTHTHSHTLDSTAARTMAMSTPHCAHTCTHTPLLLGQRESILWEPGSKADTTNLLTTSTHLPSPPQIVVDNWMITRP